MKHIVIFGGGYAGVAAAVKMGGIMDDVTLVNRNSYHHLTTLLHQPTGIHLVDSDYSRSLEGKKRVTLILGKIVVCDSLIMLFATYEKAEFKLKKFVFG